jgi:flavin reductase (DIM6/NTAB) family NADH-FMN oxidoreductase RutF
VIDQQLKRALGQMIKGVQIVASSHDGVTRAYTSHWVSQIAFEEPIVMASVSPKHDTFPIIEAAGWFTVSICAGDQVDAGQYFSYPGRKFRYLADEFLTTNDNGKPVLVDAIAWLDCEVFDRTTVADHELFFARVTDFGYGRLKEPPLVYSSRHGWRIVGDKARPPGVSIRDQLLARLADLGIDASGPDDEEN